MDIEKYKWDMTEVKSQTVSEFWVIDMNYVDNDKWFNITQDVLINNIFKTCGMEYCEYRWNPTAVVAPLGNEYLGKEDKLQD